MPALLTASSQGMAQCRHTVGVLCMRPVCLSVYLLTYLPTYLPVCLSYYLSRHTYIKVFIVRLFMCFLE